VGDDDYSRDDESESERLDRNYGELLQELRVAQTGVQILFAFLLGIAFQQQFQKIESYQRGIYLITLVAAACAATMLIAPVAIHRMLFRRHQKNELVIMTSRLASIGLVFLAIAVLSAVLLVIDVVVNLTVGIVITAVLALLLISLWYLLPLGFRRRHPGRDLSPDR
jgi:O-antigen/teichoic acid export membrane protein